MIGGARLIGLIVFIVVAALAGAGLTAARADASRAQEPWPPADGRGLLFAHFGEEHWNDDDSDLTLSEVVADTARYRPDLVTMSGDKANDGTARQLERWKRIMSRYDRRGVPYLAAVGNHDRTSPLGLPPGTAGLLTPKIQGSLGNYKRIFADRPYPFGDAESYERIGPSRPANDPAGASSHYYADIGRVRWIFLDNSCWGLRDCDRDQSPGFPDPEGISGQLQFLERKAREATRAGRVVFAVMHIPTRDPRDQSQIDPTSFNHVMGKGLSPTQAGDNDRFERVVARSGVDGVFVAHIKGQWVYEGRGGVPYYIDGGAGGELYTDGPLGTDHGYWHGYRLVRVRGGRITTDAVPILDAIEVGGPSELARGEIARFQAVGTQEKEVGEPIALDLRDPDPIPRSSGGLLGGLGAFATGDGLFLAPALALFALLALRAAAPRRRRRIALGSATVAVAAGGLGAVALAQQDIPTSTPRSSLPNPARIWTSSDRFVLRPVPSASDDPRRSRTQTEDGAFRARCPGSARVTITSGFERSSRLVTVPSRRGPIARWASIRGRTARVKLRQRAEVIVRVKRRGRVVRTVRRGCIRAGQRARRFRWDGRVGRRGKLRPARPGRYRLQLLVRSDREPLRRARIVRVR